MNSPYMRFNLKVAFHQQFEITQGRSIVANRDGNQSSTGTIVLAPAVVPILARAAGLRPDRPTTLGGQGFRGGDRCHLPGRRATAAR